MYSGVGRNQVGERTEDSPVFRGKEKPGRREEDSPVFRGRKKPGRRDEDSPVFRGRKKPGRRDDLVLYSGVGRNQVGGMRIVLYSG